MKITQTLFNKNRFQRYCLVLAVMGINFAMGQVKIGESPETIDPASLLELESTSKTLVLPRVSNSEMNAITPLNGALIYNTEQACAFFFDGTLWKDLCSGSSQISFIDNNDGTFTIDVGNGPILINGAPETVTKISDNDNGSYTYTAEDGVETIINTGVLNGDHVGIPGSVFFANSSTGSPFEANEDFFWDNTNKRLGIGTNTPTNELEVEGILKSSRISSSRGTGAFPSYHFTGSFNSGMFSPTPGTAALASSGQEVVRVTGGNRVGIMVTDPQATLHVGGNLRVDGNIISGSGKAIAKKETTNASIRRLSEPKAFLTLDDHTLILEGKVEQVILPAADATNIGHIFILKDLGGAKTELSKSYKDFNNEAVTATKRKGTIWIQSDGVEWQQIN